MRIKTFLTTVLVALMLTFISSTSLHALGIGVGVSTWYTWWEQEEEGTKTDMGDTLMYGPLLSLRFSPQWSLSTAFLYGQFKWYNEERGEYEEPDRYDSDTTLSYSINKYLTLFAGFKFMGYKTSDSNLYGYGPGIGIGVVVPVTERIMVMGNISGIYQWQSSDYDSDGTSYTDEGTSTGFNTTISVGYYIPAASVMLIAGFRYQYFQLDMESGKNNEDYTQDHTFYGYTFSAVYSFTI